MPQNVGLVFMLDRLPACIVAGIVGWCLGWASAWFSAWLHPPDETPLKSSETPADQSSASPVQQAWLRTLLIRDPIVQGASAVVWAAIPWFVAGDWLHWAETGLLSLPLIQVAVTDFRTRYVYTVVAAIGILLGLAFGWQVHHAEWWTSLAGAAGSAIGFGAIYGLGYAWTRGRVEAMARGDIGIAAMVGAGAATYALQALFLGMLISGVIAAAVWMRTRSRHSYFAYGPGLCIGGLVTLFLW
jgi:Type IV leader peptidase family